MEARCTRTEGTGGFELPNVGVANQTWGLCKSSDAITTEPSPMRVCLWAVHIHIFETCILSLCVHLLYSAPFPQDLLHAALTIVFSLSTLEV